MGLVEGRYILFACESDYREYLEEYDNDWEKAVFGESRGIFQYICQQYVYGIFLTRAGCIERDGMV